MLMMNDTNGTLATEEEQNTRSFAYYTLFIEIVFILPMFFFYIVLMMSVFVEKSIPVAIRFILCNILAASEVVILGLGVILMDIIVLSAQHQLLQSDFVCRLIYITLAIGSASRLILMPTFANVVVLLVRHGTAKIKLLPIVMSVVLLWLLSTLPNLAVFSPQVWVFTFNASDACSLYATGVASIIYSFAYITVYGLCSLLITAVSAIFGIVYIKRHTISQDRSILKNMMKFAVFLLLGNTISFIGISIPLLISTFATAGRRSRENNAAIGYGQSITVLCSLIPLPFLLLIFFKPMRMRFLRILCFTCYKIKDKINSSRKQ